MHLRTLSRLVLVFSLLLSVLSLTTPVQAQTDPTKLVIWCPTTVTLPKSGKEGCTKTYPTLAELQADLRAPNPSGPSGPGTIWIGKNYNSDAAPDSNQLWDGNALKNMAKSALTIKGGWNGPGKGTLNPLTPSRFEGDSFTILNWKGGITLRNLVVQSAITTGCPAPYSAALCVYTKGSIKLDRVQALDNLNSQLIGAVLDNTASVSSPPAPLSVTNSQFKANGSNVLPVYSGLVAYSHGTITVSNVQAQDNTGAGALVDNSSGSGSVLIRGTNTFLGNGYSGLEVYTNGSVTAIHMIAYDNGGANPSYGVYIDAKKAVTITGSGKFKSNTIDGLSILSTGPITAKNLTVTSNGFNGIHIKSDDPITAQNVTASFNPTGFLLETTAPQDVQAVTLTNVNADWNDLGLEIHADGTISLACSSAFANNAQGLIVQGATNPLGAAALKLQGFLSYGNGMADITLSTAPVVSTSACP